MNDIMPGFSSLQNWKIYETVKIKDNEIERLKAEIDNLKTLMQIKAQG